MNVYLINYGTDGENMLWNAENETIARNVAGIYLNAWKSRGLIKDATVTSIKLWKMA